jgi:hypothetical protein
MFVTNASTSIIYYVRRFFFEWMGGEVARSFEDSYLKWDEMTEIYECKPGSRPVLLPDWSCSRGNPPVFLGKKTLV